MTKSSKNSSFEDHYTTSVYMRKLLYIECIFLMLSNLLHSRSTLLHVLPLSHFFPAPPPSDLWMNVSNMRVKAFTLVTMMIVHHSVLRFSVTVCFMKEHIALVCRVNPESCCTPLCTAASAFWILCAIDWCKALAVAKICSSTLSGMCHFSAFLAQNRATRVSAAHNGDCPVSLSGRSSISRPSNDRRRFNLKGNNIQT